MASTKDLARQFEDGEVGFADLAAALRNKQFGKVQKSEGGIDTSVDPGVPEADSFFWIGLLYNRDVIDDDEYEELAEAAGE